MDSRGSHSAADGGRSKTSRPRIPPPVSGCRWKQQRSQQPDLPTAGQLASRTDHTLVPSNSRQRCHPAFRSCLTFPVKYCAIMKRSTQNGPCCGKDNKWDNNEFHKALFREGEGVLLTRVLSFPLTAFWKHMSPARHLIYHCQTMDLDGDKWCF